MKNNANNRNDQRMVASAILVIVGSMFSGPFGYLIVNLVNPIPWKDAPSFAAQYHPIQVLCHDALMHGTEPDPLFNDAKLAG